MCFDPCRWLGRTSSSIVRSVSRSFYYLRLICQVFCKRFPTSCVGQDYACNFGVLHGGSRSITHSCDKSWDYSWATLLSIYPRLSTRDPKCGSLNFSTCSGVSGPSQILSSINFRGAESSISLWRWPCSRKCPRVCVKVERRSNMMALWYTLTPTMHPNNDADDSVQLLPFVRFLSFWSIFCFGWVDLTLDY